MILTQQRITYRNTGVNLASKTLTIEDIGIIPVGVSTLDDIPAIDLDGNPITGVDASLPPDTYKALKQHEDPVELLPRDFKTIGQNVLDLQTNPEEMSFRIKNAIYFSDKFKMDFQMADNLSGEIARQKWDIANMTPQQIFKKIQEAEDTLLKNQIGESFDLAPFSTFGTAFTQSLAGKPALALRGAQVFTPGEALGLDELLEKSSDFFESLRDVESKREIDIKAAGRLWPVDEGDAWWKLNPKAVPEAINAWAANIGDQIPLMLFTFAGRQIGRLVGTIAAPPIAAAAAIVTGGPDPTDVVTIPVVAKAVQEISKHIGGMIPLIAIEAGGFMDYTNALGIDKDIAEKYARRYAPVSGLIEYSQQIFRLKAFSGLTQSAQNQILGRILKRVGGALFEGLEEFSQESLQNFLIGKAIGEMRVRRPEFKANEPRIFEGGGRAFAIGAGVSLFTTGMGSATRRVVAPLSLAAKTSIDKATIAFVENIPEDIEAGIETIVTKAEEIETAKGVSDEVSVKIEETAPVELTEAEAAEKLGTTLEQIRFNNELRDRLSENKIIITDDIRAEFKPKAPVKGLTKAEQKILTPEQQAKARFAQVQGEKVGFKAGEVESREKAKRVLQKIREAKELTKGLQGQAIELAREFLKHNPEIKKDFLARIPKVTTPEQLALFTQEIERGVERAEKDSALSELKIVANQIKPDKMRPEFGEPARKLLDSFKISKSTIDTTLKINDLLDYARQALNSLDPDSVGAVEAQSMIDSLEAKRGKTIGVRELDTESIQQIADTLSSLRAQNLQENSIITSEKADTISSHRESLNKDVE